MREIRSLSKPLTLLAVVLVAACGGPGETETEGGKNVEASRAQPSGKGACALLLQDEVDELFGRAVGAGMDEDLGEGVTLCTWPASGEPRLLLQVGPASEDVRAAVDLGEGYRVSEVSGMAGPAAVAVLDPGGKAPPSVAVLARTEGAETVVVSPIGLDLAETGPRFERFKSIVDAAAGRLPGEKSGG